MTETRGVVAKALELRAKAGVKVRQPLQRLTVKGESLAPEYIALIKDEVNVKEVIASTDATEEVALDLTITPALQAEGEARDFIRAVQDMRKQAGLEASDTIVLSVQSSGAGEKLIEEFKAEIMTVVGAKDIVFTSTKGNEMTIGEHSFTVALEKV